MTVIYCGSCGAANGAAAKFCRQCGTDLSNQTAKRANNQTPGVASPTRSATKTKAAAVKPQLRIVTPPAAGEAPTAQPVPMNSSQPQRHQPNTPPPNSSETLRQMREARRIEQQQEEDARQIKQAVTGSLSQRLAQAAGNKSGSKIDAPAPATASAEMPQARVMRSTGNLSTNAARIKNAPSQRPSGVLAEPANNSGKFPVSASTAMAEASGLQQHPRSGLFLRLTAGVLGVLLLGSGVYFYQHQRAGASSAEAGKRNLLSSEEESVKLIHVAEAAREKGATEEAALTLNKAIELNPQQPAPRQLLAETYETAGRHEEALKAYDGLLKVAPEHLAARLKVADIQRAKGNVLEARQQYQRILNFNLHSPEASRALEAIEEIDNALAQANAASTPFPSRPRRVAASKRMGPTLPPNLTDNGQVALIPQNPFATPSSVGLMNWSPVRPLEMPDPRTAAAYHKTQGTRYFNVREYGAAVSELQQALRLTPGDKDLYYFLGGAYKGLGQNMKAHEYYKKCDSGPYADTAQNGARQTEKAARKEFERQQKELLNSAKTEKGKPTETVKEQTAGKNLQNSFQEQE